MTVIQIHIPDELEPALQQVPGDVEEFIVEAVRKQCQYRPKMLIWKRRQRLI